MDFFEQFGDSWKDVVSPHQLDRQRLAREELVGDAVGETGVEPAAQSMGTQELHVLDLGFPIND